ncbi:bifunctional diguanylate cyclase/phosphodiesterase [Acidovorax sp. FJL06]|uniref:putative bifunctional diguanylate cyclase/phosphodiesterase n=1 Tax=Acidovorax sp. FJL06 TaxID=2153365 RepID=UPI000F57D93D|nr:EAL domain-containing protein [Acidovorax sp. FJL06]RQO84141.1 GGDEF-domain containing protein [Acidovorax sp. FJL06]
MRTSAPTPYTTAPALLLPPILLSSKLVVTGILSAGLALLTVVLALTGVDYWSSRTSMLQDSRVEAAIVADNVSAAVMFRDTGTANEMLAALRSSPMVLAAGVYDTDGVLFAHYVRERDPDFPTTLRAAGMEDALERPGWNLLEIIRPIEGTAAPLGTLYIRKSMREVHTRLAVRFFSALLIAVCVMAMATAMVLRSRAAVREAEHRLHALAHTDAVTGTGNRHAFNERLAAELELARSGRHRVALVYIDLDNFKTLNDTFGHAAGDGLLRQVAQRLQSVVRSTDTISRLGGDEFALTLRLDMDDVALDKYAQRIIGVFQAAYTEVGQQVNVTGSAGIATFPDDASDINALVSNADTAMYRAKEMGKNRCVRFDPSMNQAVVRRQTIEHALRAELEQQGGGLALHYQPLFAARGGAVVGAEALLRWTHAELGTVSPLEAVSVAEDCGLIIPLGYWVLRTACRDASRWNAHGPLRVAVNISARQLGDPQFLERVMDILREEGLPAHLLEVELTETVLMENMEAGAHTLHRLSQLGIHLAIDDFGTGYSSLAYLRQLPMRRLKIDRSFVRDLPEQEHSRTIVTAIVALAHGLGLEVTAEGVETPQQADYLVQQGCDVLQGYVFARPMPVAQFLALQAGVTAPTA